jgi:hypothetical protein
MVMGANHNFFNTEWTPATAAAPSWDDWGGDRDETCGRRHPGRLLPWEQRAVGKAYVAGAVHLFTGEGDYTPLYDGSPVTVDSIHDAQVLTHAILGGRSQRRPGADARPTLTTGDADARLCNGVASSSGSFAFCLRNNDQWVTPHWPMFGEKVPTRQFLEFSWEEAGASGGLRFSKPLDLSSDRLELRTIADPRYAAPNVRIRVSDSSGGSAVLDPEPGTKPTPLPKIAWATKLWATTVVVDASEASGVDLTDITSVDLVSGNARGRVWIADVASAPETVPPVEDRRLPQVRIDNVEIDEGSGGTKVARIPFRIIGTVTRGARFSAFTAGQQRGQVQRLVIDVAPGQKTGSIPVEYDADRSYGRDQQIQVAIWPMQGVATDDYLGELLVVEDDPAPIVDVTVTRRVREGRSTEIEVTVDGATTVGTWISVRAVRGEGENLRGTDVPRDWLDRHGDSSHPRRPLWRLYAGLYDEIPPRKDAATLQIPVRRDGVREGPEFLYLRVDTGDGERARFRVKVLDPG